MEVFLPFPGESRTLVPPMTHVKGTWLASAVAALRERGKLPEYEKRLDPRYHETMLRASTGEWYPVEALLAHYEVCEGLGFTASELLTLGEHVSQRAQGGVVELAAKLATTTGVTPWVVLALLNRLWARVAKGGGIGVFKLGPKEARVDVVQFPGCRYVYCQAAMRGIVKGVLAPFCTKVYVTMVPALVLPTQMAVTASWA